MGGVVMTCMQSFVQSGKTRTKIGYINFQKSEKGFMKKWRNYKFNLTKMYFLYFKTDNVRIMQLQALVVVKWSV